MEAQWFCYTDADGIAEESRGELNLESVIIEVACGVRT